MVRLDTFGGIDLRDSGGRVVTSVLSKPQSTALLVYLAYSRPGGFRRRDGLIALFWPERPDDPARHNLRQKLYELRRALGEGVVVSRGREEVGVSEAGLHSDVREFRVAIRESRWEDALDLYRGPFLEGFHLSRAPELQSWIDDERGALLRMAHTAASYLSDDLRERGNLRGADRWARRALEIVPHSEPTLRRIIEIQLERGDRTAALEVFRRFEERLQEEYGLEPSTETLELIGAVRGAQGGHIG